MNTFQAEPKVNDLDFQIFIEQNVLGLDVSMRYFMLMQICDTLQDLSCYQLSLILFNVPLFLVFQVLLNRIPTTILHQQVYLQSTNQYRFEGLDDLIELYYMWRVQTAKNLNLPLNASQLLIL